MQPAEGRVLPIDYLPALILPSLRTPVVQTHTRVEASPCSVAEASARQEPPPKGLIVVAEAVSGELREDVSLLTLSPCYSNCRVALTTARASSVTRACLCCDAGRQLWFRGATPSGRGCCNWLRQGGGRSAVGLSRHRRPVPGNEVGHNCTSETGDELTCQSLGRVVLLSEDADVRSIGLLAGAVPGEVPAGTSHDVHIRDLLFGNSASADAVVLHLRRDSPSDTAGLLDTLLAHVDADVSIKSSLYLVLLLGTEGDHLPDRPQPHRPQPQKPRPLHPGAAL